MKKFLWKNINEAKDEDTVVTDKKLTEVLVKKIKDPGEDKTV